MSLVERSRAGVRAWVRGAGAGLRRAGPYGIAAFLTASAVAPIAGAALGAPAEFSASLQQLGGMGSNYLADAMVSAADRMRGTDVTLLAEDQWRDTVAAELLARLEAGDEALRQEMAELLLAIGAVEVALRATDDRGRAELVAAFESLGSLAEDTARSLASISRTLAEQSRAQQQQTELIVQSLVAVAALRQEVVGRVTRDTPDPAPPAATGDVPYPGLSSFEALDARWFRGRETLVAELLGRLSEQVLGGPPLVVVGVSGVGKSSVLRAGVLPAIFAGGLADDSGSWPWLVMTPGAHPLDTFTGKAEALRSLGLGDMPWVILVDQFEEVFTQCTDPAERAAFVEALAELRPGVLIIAVRADFYPQCTELAPMVPLLGPGQVVVGPLGTDELRRAITEPAAEAGLTVEPGLVDALLTDLGAPGYDPGALPLLAHALLATWQRRAGDTLTVRGYRDTGGLQRAVAASAEAIYRDLDDPGRTRLRTALLALVTLADGRPVRHRAARSEVDTEALRPLIAARFVTAGEDTVEISHEALLTGWPRLAGWLVEAREELVLRQRLTQAAADWTAAGEDPDALYRGVRLAAAREYAQGRTLPAGQARFLQASAAAADERERARERTNRRLRRLAAGLAVALLLVAAGGVVVWRQSVAADRESQAALSRARGAESRLLFETDPAGAVHAALEGWGRARTKEARDALLLAQHATVFVPLGTEPGAQLAALTTDGTRAATAFRNGRVQIWDTATQEQLGPELMLPDSFAVSLAFSPDGRFLAAGGITTDQKGGGDNVAIWDVGTGTLRQRLPALGAAAWLPDSSALLAPLSDIERFGHLGSFDPTTGRLLDAVPVDDIASLAMAVSRDGSQVALTGPAGGTIVRRSDGRRLADLGELTSVAFAADGTVFGTTGSGPVRAWQPEAGWRAVTLNGPDAYLGGNRAQLAVTTDGTVIVGGDGDKFNILALTVGGPRQAIPGYPSTPSAVALSGDDRMLLLTGPTEPPRLARINQNLLPLPQVVPHVAYDPTGTRLAASSAEPEIRIFDPRTRARTGTLALGGEASPLGLAYGPDGSIGASLEDGRVVVFEPDGRLRGTVRVPAGFRAATVAFSPDGKLLTVVTNKNAPSVGEEQKIERQDDPDVLVWEAGTLKPRGDIRVPLRVSMDQAFTPDGRYLLVAANASFRTEGTGYQDGSVWRYALPELTPVDHAELPGTGVSQLAVSPDGESFAVVHGQSAAVLRVEGLTPQRRLGKGPVRVKAVAWSPDGHTVATASGLSDDVIRLWDVRQGSLLAEVRGSSFQYGRMVFSPDTGTLAAGTNNWAVTLWQLDAASLVPELCDELRRAYKISRTPLPAICTASAD